MVIRAITPTEAVKFIALRREMLADAPWAFASSPQDDVTLDPTHLAARLAEPGNAIVGAFDENALIACAGVMKNRHAKMAHRAHIWGVYCTPSARGRGVATEVLSAVLALVRTWPGVNSAGLSVSVRSHTAQRLYQRLGFKAWGLEPGAIMLSDGQSFDEVHMVVFLTERG